MNLCFLRKIIGSCFQPPHSFNVDQPTCKMEGLADSHPDEDNLFAYLPQPLLEVILASQASTQDKASLRLTCKLFRAALDASLVCIGSSCVVKLRVVRRFLCRVQQSNCIKTIALKTAPQRLGKCFKYLPEQLTTLILTGEPQGNSLETLDLTALRNMRCLTALSILFRCNLSGLECVNGLTSLISCSPIGSVVHLAPTLKLLCLDYSPSSEDLNQLTNLEVLQLRGSPPVDLFETLDQVPLKSLFINCCQNAALRLAWEAAPTTLTCLTIVDMHRIQRSILPAHITHLQLVSAVEADFEKAAEVLPGITALDVYIQYMPLHGALSATLPCRSFSHLEEFANLRSLRLCLNAPHSPWDHQQVLSRLPDVAAAVERGVRLQVLANVDEMFVGGVLNERSRPIKSQWATYK